MREIKFRGQRIRFKEWVYGSLIISTVAGKQHYHIQKEFTAGHLYCFEIIPETIGQFTGMKDKNKKDIYEGDVVKDSERIQLVTFGDLSFEEYAGTGWILTGIPETDDNSFWLAPDDGFVLEIIGNIHSNPSLLTNHP